MAKKRAAKKTAAKRPTTTAGVGAGENMKDWRQLTHPVAIVRTVRGILAGCVSAILPDGRTGAVYLVWTGRFFRGLVRQWDTRSLDQLLVHDDNEDARARRRIPYVINVRDAKPCRTIHIRPMTANDERLPQVPEATTIVYYHPNPNKG